MATQHWAVENSRANLPLPKYHRVYLVLRQQLDLGSISARKFRRRLMQSPAFRLILLLEPGRR